LKQRKKALLPLLLFCLLLLPLTASCSLEKRNSLFYQEGELTVSGRYVKNGTEYSVTVEKAANGSGEVLYHSPETLSGMRFACSESGVTMLFCGLSLPLGAIEHDAAILLSLFSLSEEHLGSLTAQNGEIEMRFDGVRVTLDSENGLPLAFESRRGGREIVFYVESLEQSAPEA